MSGNKTIARDILQAVEFAADKHRDQRRKDRHGSPYINHPVQVAELLTRVGGIDDLATLLAAVLHDTVEDTDTTFAELEEAFGPEIRDLVAHVTDDTTLPKAERKQLQKEHARGLPDRAKLIKIADKTCNVRDIGRSPPKDWSEERRIEYLRWAASVVDECRGVNAELERYFDECLASSSGALGVRQISDEGL